MAGFDMKDYVPVNERVDAFYTRYPDGSIQSEIVELTASRVTVKAYAYRKPDDERPGIGHSSLDIPGSTPYTKGSEIENCETSAWGRAIAALGFEVKRGIASHEEIRNKQPQDGERGAKSGTTAPSHATTRPAASPTEQQLRNRALEMAVERYGAGVDAAMKELADEVGVPKGGRATVEQLHKIIALIETPPASSSDSQAATAPAPVTPLAVEPEPAPSMDDVLAAAGPGAEEIPPKPSTDAYRALTAQEKANARAYWHRVESAEPVQESLLGEPVA